MLRRIFLQRFARRPFNFDGKLLTRNFSSEKPEHVLRPGGGLGKPQGGLKEEKYFTQHDKDLIVRIRDHEPRLKCEDCLDNWSEFEKVLEASMEACSINKHKNCMEEAFFMSEQNDEMKIFQDKLKLDNRDDSLKVSQITTDQKNQNSDIASDKEIRPPQTE